MDRYDFGASPELLLQPARAYGKQSKSVRKTGVLSEEKINENLIDNSDSSSISEDDDDDEDDDDLSYYSPVIPIFDKSLLSALKHPKKH